MKVTVTFECDDAYRRAICHYYSSDNGGGRASRKDVEAWFAMHGGSMDDDLRQAHGKCCWGDADEAGDEGSAGG